MWWCVYLINSLSNSVSLKRKALDEPDDEESGDDIDRMLKLFGLFKVSHYEVDSNSGRRYCYRTHHVSAYSYTEMGQIFKFYNNIAFRLKHRLHGDTRIFDVHVDGPIDWKL